MIKSLLEKNLISNFFFIRYWEKGPHIRLRMKGETLDRVEQIKPYLDFHIVGYYKRFPSLNFPNQSNNEFIFPMNSIQQIEYAPEVNRYGGNKGIEIAEKFFEASSKVVLKILEERDSLSYDETVSLAIQLNIALSVTFRMSVSEMQSFYDLIFASMLQAVNMSQPSVGVNTIVERFERSYQTQRKELLNFLSNFLPIVYGSEKSFENEWLSTWINDCKLIATLFYNELSAGNIQTFHINKLQNTQGEWYILSSYVHMSNNRLGLLNSDEAFIAYIISSALKEISNRNMNEPTR